MILVMEIICDTFIENKMSFTFMHITDMF